MDDDFEGDELGDFLLAASIRSLETLTEAGPETIRSLLVDLAANPYDASQLLLYRGLSAGGRHFADWATSLLLKGGRRLYCDYVSDISWVVRELVGAVASHITDVIHRKLEDLFRDLHNGYESHNS